MTTFDLSQVGGEAYRLDYRGVRLRKSVVVVGSLLVDCLGAVVLIHTLWTGARVLVALSGLIIVMATPVAIMAIRDVMFRYGEPAASLSLDSGGLEAAYPNGRLLRVRWEHPGFSLIIHESDYPDVHHKLLRPTWHPRVVLTDEAGMALVKVALEAGLSVRELEVSSGVGRRVKRTLVERPRVS